MSKYILITGGGFSNKGAQSMTFIAISEVKKRFPSISLVLLSEEAYNMNIDEKNLYSFDIYPINLGLTFELLGGFYKVFGTWKMKNINTSKYQQEIKALIDILKNTVAIIDISGFTLSSQRGITDQLKYLFMIKLAKKHGIKVYIMPQSFGPFQYKGKYKFIINHLIKKYMNYPQAIFAREIEGYNCLVKSYNLKNVKQSQDLVLLNKKLDHSKIYNEYPVTLQYDVKGVAIVPNMRNFDHGDSKQILSIYNRVIHKLISYGKTVYLIRHSFEDIEACMLIKEGFANNDQVIVIEEDISCWEFQDLVKKFDFLIASRFHSIVHAYKYGIPCIVLGWATKYRELLKNFKQDKYFFDVRGNIDSQVIEMAIEMMIAKSQKESSTILSILKSIQTHNVFDVIEVVEND